MGNGLTMNLEEFRSLPQQKKLDCLFQNQVYTMDLIKGYKLYYKITSIVGGFLVLGVGILFKMQLGV